MKPIKLKPAPKQTSLFQEEINSLINNIDEAIAEKEFIKCIEALKNGDESKISDVVTSSELVVLKVILQFEKLAIPIETLINCANEGLAKLAQSQLNDKESDVYLRFCAFTVKQSILKFNETHPNS